MNRRRLKLAGMLAIPALLAGCGGGDPENRATGPTGEEKSPLSEYMGGDMLSGTGGGMVVSVGGGGGSSPGEEDLTKQRKVEDLTAACMRALGFEYVPVPPNGREKSRFEDAFNLPPDKFAEQFGYGISTFDMVPRPDEKDPNTRIRDRLSAKAKAAYDKALNGVAGEVVAVDGATKSQGSQDMGCRGKAAEQVFGKPADSGKSMKEARRFDSLWKDIEALRKRIETDPRVAEAAKAWSDCMADAGHTGLRKVEDARNKVQQKMDAVMGTVPQSTPGPDGGEVVSRKVEQKDMDPVKLAEVKRFELDIAKDDYDCAQKHYRTTYREVQFKLEREFVDTHRTILEQHKAWLAEMRGNR
jgi:hypothetical protein